MSKDSRPEEGKKVEAQGPPGGLVIEQIRESAKAPSGTPKSEFERLQQLVAAMRTETRSEQMITEQELQGSLTTASEKVGDARRMEQVFALVDRVSQQLEQGEGSLSSDPGPFLHLVEQLQAKVVEQAAMTDTQVARCMQQAVSALAQSEAALFQSKSLGLLAAQVKEFEESARLAAGVGKGGGSSGGGSSSSGSSGGSGNVTKPGSDKMNNKRLPLQ
ncbi:MAG: hypothetical protein ACYC6V_03105 [Bacillota bacterium]